MFSPEVIEMFKKQRLDLLTKINRLESELSESKIDLSALETLLRNEGHSILEDHYDIPDKYPFNGTWTDKLLYVLFEMEEATAKEIVEAIIDEEDILNEYDRDKLFRTITLYASRLYNEKRLSARKVGNTNVYSLRKPVSILDDPDDDF